MRPILFEIMHALDKLLDEDIPTTIDLAGLPFGPGELERLEESLGDGELAAELDALGKSHIRETAYPGVWWIEHRNVNDEVVGRYLEVTRLPDILCSQDADIWRRSCTPGRECSNKQAGGRQHEIQTDRRRDSASQRRIAARISQILCDNGFAAGAATQHDSAHRSGDRECPTTFGHLAVVPGMHRLHRIADTFSVANRRGPDLRRHFARLPSHAAGRLRRTGRSRAACGHGRERRQLSRTGRWLDPDGKPGLLDDRRHQQCRHAHGYRQGRGRRRRDRLLRRFRRPSGCQAESDRRGFGTGPGQGQSRSSTYRAARRSRWS